MITLRLKLLAARVHLGVLRHVRPLTLSFLAACLLINAFMVGFTVWHANKDYVRTTHWPNGCEYVEHFDNRAFHATQISAHLACRQAA